MMTLALMVWMSVCAVSIWSYAGWGAAHLALPRSLRPWLALCVPLVGYAITMLVGYLGVSSVFNLRWSLALLFVIATGLNMLAWRRGARPWKAGGFGEYGLLLAVLAATLLAGVAPLLSYGYLTSIGRGWDTESYWPMAQYLVDYPLARIGDAPANPLRDLVRDPPRIGLTLGFSVVQGMAMLLSGQDVVATFAPLLALVRALAVLAAFVWLRATMGLGRAAALLAAALSSAGALMLWVAFFNFGMQLSSWPLMLLGLALGIAVVEELAQRRLNAWPALLLGAVVLAAVPIAYYPALTVFGPIAAGLGLARVAEAWRGRNQSEGRESVSPLGLLAAALAVGAVTLALSVPAIIDYFEGFSFRYSIVAEKIGPDRFIPLSDTLGLTAFRLPAEGPQPPQALVIAALLAVVLLALGLLLRSDNPDAGRSPRLRWALVLVPLAVYLGWLRWGRPYEYAYMKSSSYAGVALWGALMLGWQRLWRMRTTAARLAATALVAAPLVCVVWAQGIAIAEHSRGPALFGRDLVALRELTATHDDGLPLMIGGDARFVGPNNGLFATLWYGHPIWGRVTTAYTGRAYWPAGGTPGYVLLAGDETPWPLVLGATERWRSRSLAVFELPHDRAIVTGRERMHVEEPPADSESPAAMAIWRRAGALRAAQPGAPLLLQVGDQLRLDAGQPVGGGGARTVTLRLATLQPQTLTIRTANAASALELAAGLSSVTFNVETPAIVQLEAQQSLALVDGYLDIGAAPAAPLAALDASAIAWSAQATEQDGEIRVHLELANPGQHALRAELNVVGDSYSAPVRLARVLAALPRNGAWEVRLAPRRGASEARVNGETRPLLEASVRVGAPPGRYFGVVTLYSGEQVVAQVPLFTMQAGEDGHFTLDAVPFTVEMATAGIPAVLPGNQRGSLVGPLAVGAGALTLEQVIVQRIAPEPGSDFDAPFRAGEPFTVQLYWHAQQPDPAARMVSVQVLGDNNEKRAQWDGPLGGAWQPSPSWQSGERMRQDVPLVLAAGTPPGHYRVVLVAYDPSTGKPTPIGGQQTMLLREIEVR